MPWFSPLFQLFELSPKGAHTSKAESPPLRSFLQRAQLIGIDFGVQDLDEACHPGMRQVVDGIAIDVE